METTRRGFLGAAGTAAAAALAGCSAPVGQEQEEDTASGPYTAVYEQVIPSVVRVRVYGLSGPTAQGSGWVYDEGTLVTNQHVVDGADTIRVQFKEGEWREAEVLGGDVYSDLAALSVPDAPDYAEPLPLVESEPPVGTRVVALGSPFGLGGSLSQGVVSGQNRSLPSVNDFTIADAVQTDAALNPGNSGGPLVTLDGEVAGVVTSASGENLGFAISAALVKRVVPALVEDGEYDHSFMGVRIVGVSPLLARANDLPEIRGVYVDSVLEDGPSGGVLEGSTGEERVEGVEMPTGGDTIIRFGDRRIDTMADLSTYLALATSPGDTIPVTVWRDGEKTTLDLTLGERPEPGA